MDTAQTRLVGDVPARQRFILGSTVWTIPGVNVAMGVLDQVWPKIPGPIDMATRLAVAARSTAVASIPVAAAILVIAGRRFFSGAHNPILAKEDPRLQIHCRVLQNSLEQWALFAAGVGAASTFLPEAHLHLLPINAVLFLLARGIFWIGYLRPGNVLGRAPGVQLTFTITVQLLAYGGAMSLWSFFARP